MFFGNILPKLGTNFVINNLVRMSRQREIILNLKIVIILIIVLILLIYESINESIINIETESENDFY